MKFSYLLFAFFLVANMAEAKKQDNRLFEMRIYYCEPGRLDALLTRFREHTTKIFENHGMTNIGYWLPINNTDNKLIYVLAYPDKEAREKAWKEFGADPEWKKVQSESEASGKIVSKVDVIFMKATDFSAKIKPSKSKTGRVFELRTYTTPEGKLPNLLTRFREHTTKLFEKHGMTNVAYWVPETKPNTLIYILAHPSEEAGKKAFDTFRLDPEWVKVRDESEKNGKIVEKVESVYMNATDFSTIK